MRLINTHTLELEQFVDETIQPYAILSHRWEEQEVSFQDYQRLRVESDVHSKGLVKIRRFCELAAKDGYDYGWIDTCCINKDSSAELSEAINAMFRWYKASGRCYVYLSDVPPKEVTQSKLSENEIHRILGRSAWFTRGWTLQELIAPKEVFFFGRDWFFLGTKQSLQLVLTQRTGIDKEILEGALLQSRSIAQRMCWASNRVTTRIEDIAYCLLGIFDVNMPMLYGEGSKAFLRLQSEIIRQSDDHTIFAWPMRQLNMSGLLADAPSAFKGCGSTEQLRPRKGHASYSLTNRGLAISLQLKQVSVDLYYAVLDCCEIMACPHPELLQQRANKSMSPLGIFLRRLHENDQYARVRVSNLGASDHLPRLESELFSDLLPRPKSWISSTFTQRPVHVRQAFSDDDDHAVRGRINGFRLIAKRYRCDQAKVNNTPPAFIIDEMYTMPFGDLTFTNIFSPKKHNFIARTISPAFDADYNPCCIVSLEAGLSFQRNAAGLDVSKWSPVRGLGKVAFPLEDKDKYHNYWVLKGDRLEGLHVHLYGLAADFRFKRMDYEGKLIWHAEYTEYGSDRS